MPMRPALAVLACTTAAVAVAVAGAWATRAHAASVTIYRCTDAQGRETLRDTPCLAGERQRARTMLRPQDPAPRATPAAPPPSAPAPAAPVRVVVATAPRPLYECTTPDGDRYESENADGNPRWVPLWTLGYPIVTGVPIGRPTGGLTGRVDVGGGDVRGTLRIGDPRPAYPRGPGHAGPGIVAVPAGTWVRDACHALPAAEVCDRLRDRRWALNTRYNSAMQGERAQITLEQRGIDARLDSECGGR
ncbi:DUF4124 domain-containing protein [Cognatilysobacter tabacisoli]|uniref:DUF4124 domain-containing protein n=1 Tax=Cognatilysobacter tabacisoli TaxID=2315424 RepID=UPI000E6B4232|nr:DUF4124 domain-containing protein [Lysobacter tabacisoli]